MAPLLYAPWTSDIELAFYSALASLKINHDKLDSSARKVLGLYEIQHRDPPERSNRMQIHGNALMSDECVRLVHCGCEPTNLTTSQCTHELLPCRGHHQEFQHR